jgi:hypothetical protein
MRAMRYILVVVYIKGITHPVCGYKRLAIAFVPKSYWTDSFR